MFHSLYTHIQETNHAVPYNIQLDQPARQSNKEELGLFDILSFLLGKGGLLHQICMVHSWKDTELIHKLFCVFDIHFFYC